MLFSLMSLSLILSACSQETETFTKQKYEFYEVHLGDTKYYFKYPSGAAISENNGMGNMTFGSCNVNFKQAENFDGFANGLEGLKKENHSADGMEYRAWYKDDLLVGYEGGISKLNYNFWSENEEKGVQNCVVLVDDMVESFTDELAYMNDEYGFSVPLPADFKVEYLPEDEGVLVKKWIENKEVKDFEPYAVEMGVKAVRNLEEFDDLSDFVGANYAGYSFQFEDYKKFSGYYVQETQMLEAINHFFVLSDDAEIIYDIYLKVTGKHYAAHEKQFKDFVQSVEIE